MRKAAWVFLFAFPALSQRITLESGAAQMSWELGGGGLVDFHLKSNNLNPYTWEQKSNEPAHPRGHFLCADRWGQPSAAELSAGMPFHGEAPHKAWRKLGASGTELEMAVQLPMARLAIRRAVKLEGSSALVTETILNEAALGRPYNFVQHPTIGPPFLDPLTVVDSNARRGFMQSSPLPNPEDAVVVWPQALRDGLPVSLRYLTDDPNPNVVSYVIDEDWGWTTALNAAAGMMVGYVWRASDYPWLNMWRHVEGGRPFARGLEFGTTGLHQPFPVLLRKGRIFGRPLFSYLDSTEKHERRYQVFLMEAPADLAGVASMKLEGGNFVFTGRDGKPYAVKSLYP
ncbi:MAG: hypothetical protein R2729_12285 [Bryobacteraceae bacterium]